MANKPKSPRAHAAELRSRKAIKEELNEERLHGPTGEPPLLLAIFALICLIGLVTGLGIAVA